MDSRLNKSKLIYRKLKISDYQEFRKLFKSCFKRNISFDFFKWRYFSNRESFCYGVFKQRTLIANVGMFSIKLNNKEKSIQDIQVWLKIVIEELDFFRFTTYC